MVERPVLKESGAFSRKDVAPGMEQQDTVSHHAAGNGGASSITVFQRDAAGVPTHILGLGADATERKEAELVRDSREEVRRRLFRASTEVMAEMTVDGLLQRVADAARELTSAEIGICGHSVASGKVTARAVSPAEGFAACRLKGSLDAEKGGVYLAAQLHDSIRLTDEQLRAHPEWRGLPDGHLPLRGLLGARLTGADGDVNGLIMVSGKDIGEFTEEDEDTLRHLAAMASLAMRHLEASEQAEALTREAMWVGEALAKEAQVLKVIMETTDTQLAYFDSKFNFVKVNDAYAKGSGRSAEELVGANLFSLFPNAETQAIFEDVLATGRAVHLRDKPLLFQGQPWRGVAYWDWTLTPVKNASGQVEGLVLSLLETTDRKNTEKLKDEFIRMVSHELRTPLTVVLGALNTATTDGVSSAEMRSLLETAASGAESLAAILDNLVELARYQAERLYLAKVPVDVARLAENVAGKIGVRYDTHSFHIEVPQAIRGLEADPIRLERILYNLIENAAKFSPEGTPITVSGRREADYVVISVGDQGAGIPARDLQKLFDPFKTMRNRGGKQGPAGFGLGLLTCKRLVEAHGGQIWAESQEGKGSTFYFSLPPR